MYKGLKKVVVQEDNKITELNDFFNRAGARPGYQEFITLALRVFLMLNRQYFLTILITVFIA